MPSVGVGCRRRLKSLGERHCCTKKKNHLEQTEYSGQGSIENPRADNEATQSGVPDMQFFL